MLIHNLCLRLSERLANQIGWREKTGILAYGLEMVLGESLKFGLLIILSAFFNLLTPIIFVLAVSVPLRLVSGGGHCTTQARCTVLTVLVYLPLAFAAKQLSVIYNNRLSFFILPLIVATTLIVIHFWVPRENPNRKFKSENEKTKFRILSNLILLLWVISCVVIYIFSPSHSFKLYFVSTAAGLLWQNFMVTPVGYRFISTLDTSFNLFKRIKEVN